MSYLQKKDVQATSDSAKTHPTAIAADADIAAAITTCSEFPTIWSNL